MINYKIIPLGEMLKEYDEHLIENTFKKFSCQREIDLENFLIKKSIPYENTDLGKTYLIIDMDKLNKGDLVIVAYFTIAQKAIDISTLSKNKKRKMLGEYPGRDSLDFIPTYLIGQLGRCDDYSSNDLSGQQILNECYHAISIAASVVGGKLVVLECRETMFDKVYEKKGFKKLYNELNEERLYTLYQKIDFSEYYNRFNVSA
ncbi:MAG: hypothetical protein NC231_03050 [Bacillus sp. (in: Bacteria)]|nr:hypothetical protein [Bacillus sp. (in: firmicutes)]MCM1426050.1 hypothetical protein [Eubacterium sp.]